MPAINVAKLIAGVIIAAQNTTTSKVRIYKFRSARLNDNTLGAVSPPWIRISFLVFSGVGDLLTNHPDKRLFLRDACNFL